MIKDFDLFVESFVHDEKSDSESNSGRNRKIFSNYINDGRVKNHSIESNLFNQNEININLLRVKSDKNMNKLKIAIAHIDVLDENYKNSIMKLLS